MPYDATIAFIWAIAPQDPEEIDQWDAQRVFHMLWYINAKKTLDTPASESD